MSESQSSETQRRQLSLMTIILGSFAGFILLFVVIAVVWRSFATPEVVSPFGKHVATTTMSDGTILVLKEVTVGPNHEFLDEMPCRVVVSENTPRRIIRNRVIGGGGGLNRAWIIVAFLTTDRDILDKGGE